MLKFVSNKIDLVNISVSFSKSSYGAGGLVSVVSTDGEVGYIMIDE